MFKNRDLKVCAAAVFSTWIKYPNAKRGTVFLQTLPKMQRLSKGGGLSEALQLILSNYAPCYELNAMSLCLIVISTCCKSNLSCFLCSTTSLSTFPKNTSANPSHFPTNRQYIFCIFTLLFQTCFHPL